MIEYSIDDTQFSEYKTAMIFPREYIEDMFVSLDIHGIGTTEKSASLTIHTNEEIIMAFSQRTGIPISDLVAKGRAEEYDKYLVLKLDDNIELLHAKRKE